MDYFELIEEYKKDKLSMEVKQGFELEVKKNTELRKAITNHDIANQLFDLLIEDDIRRQVKGVRNALDKNEIKDNRSKANDFEIGINSGGNFQNAAFENGGKDAGNSNPSGRNSKASSFKGYTKLGELPAKTIAINRAEFFKYAMAASVLALAVVAVTFFVNKSLIEQSPQEIYASYYTTYPNLESATRAVIDFSNVQEVRGAAYSAYDQADYEGVVSLLNKLTPGYAQELSDNFYLGLSYLELGEWGNAAALFEYVANSKSEYKNEAKWYLGLSYLRMDDCAKAKEIFIPIRDAGLDKSMEAGKIVDKIKCE